MKKIKVLSLLVSFLLVFSLLAGCGSSEKQSNGTTKNPTTQAKTQEAAPVKEVKITVMNSKGEIQTPMEEAAQIFTKENPNISVEVVLCPVGTSPFEKVSALYAAGDAPTIAILDKADIIKLKEKAVDLSGEKWVADTPFAEDCKIDGKVLAFPVSVEGCGFIYNKSVLEKAGVDPASIKTAKDLEEAFRKVEATGKAGCVIGQMDWSLGNHFSPVAYAAKSKSAADITKFLDGLKAGSIDLAADKEFSGLLNTFDIMKKYNKMKKDPMAADYSKCAEIISKGDAGFYFQGNWTWPEMEKFQADNNNFGYIPVPVSDNAGDLGNTGVQAGVTKYALIDNEQNDADKQAAGKKFLDWLVYSKAAQEALVTKAKIIMAFKNVEIDPVDPLAKSIASYMKSGNTLVFVGNLVPADHWNKLGPAWQKYLVGKTDRAELAKDIMNYWKSVK